MRYFKLGLIASFSVAIALFLVSLRSNTVSQLRFALIETVLGIASLTILADTLAVLNEASQLKLLNRGLAYHCLSFLSAILHA